MDPEIKTMLEVIGVDAAFEEQWNCQFKKLIDFHGIHGHCELFWAVNRLSPC
jgi:hypothetical protein